MDKEIKYHIKNLKIEKQKYIINNDGSITIVDLVVHVEKVKDISPPPNHDKTKHKPDKGKSKGKHMTEKRVNELIDKAIKKNNIPSEKRVEELIDKAIKKNNIPSEKRVEELIDKAIERKKIPSEDRVRQIFSEEIIRHKIPNEDRVREIISENNIVLLQAVKKIVNEAIAPISEKLDTVIKLNKLKTK